ncbi:MAG: threonyl-tRNA synthetase editing domain-containing protein, partial [Nanoarchaeota archaeon]
MKILTIHADFIEFETKKKALKEAEEVKEGKKRVEECLVVFTAVEKRDEENIAEVTRRYIQEIEDVARQVKTETIVLYPYAHLSSSLAKPKKAEELIKEAEKILLADKEKYKVIRAPFGWYKSFNISCKGHPLSELSREFSAGEEEKKKETARREGKGYDVKEEKEKEKEEIIDTERIIDTESLLKK